MDPFVPSRRKTVVQPETHDGSKGSEGLGDKDTKGKKERGETKQEIEGNLTFASDPRAVQRDATSRRSNFSSNQL